MISTAGQILSGGVHRDLTSRTGKEEMKNNGRLTGIVRFICGVFAALLVVSTGWAQNTLEVSNSSLTFTANRRGDSPDPQHVAITSAVTERIDFTVNVQAVQPADSSWLAINLQHGTTPARLRVSVDQRGLAAGDYEANVIVQSASQSIPIDVRLTVVEAPPVLRVAPASLRFAAGVSDDPTRSLFIRNAGGGDLSYSVTVAAGSEWLSVASATGVTAPNQPSLVRVTANRDSAKPADYGVLRVQAGTDTVDVPVSIVSQRQGPVLALNLTGLEFEARENQGNANNRNVLVLNLGNGDLDWQAQVLQGGEWLTLTMPSGRTRSDELGRLGLNANPGNLPAGNYYALVQVSASGADSSPQYLSAVLDIRPATDPPDPDPSPQGLFFVGDPQQAPPPNQPIRLFVSSTDPVPFQASASTVDGADWLRVAPASGVTSTDNTAMLRVTVDPTILKPGVYNGDVTVAFADRTIRTTNITLVAPATSTPAAQAKQAIREAAACIPARLSLTQTGLVNSFSSPAGWPNSLIVRLADDCGGPVLNANVVTTFSNNDPPLSMALTNPQVGLYSATWLPRSRGNVVVTTTASAPGLGTTRTDIIGGVSQSQEAPVLEQGGIVSNFYPQSGAPLALGTPVQMFGSSLSSGSDSASGLPLPQSLVKTSMLIGSTLAPLFFVSPDQVNAQIPPELETDRQYATAILSGNKYTVGDPIVLAALRPALIATDGVAVAQHADSSSVSSDSPAQAGEVITLFAAGLGATDPGIAGGNVPAPGVTARVRQMPAVTIGGKDAPVQDAVLAPDIVGVYRVTVQIPSGLDPGSQAVIIQQQGVASNQAALNVAP
jgi:uncharacterized protein (TIGR03437 family)